jgi:hypothetical protein
MDIPNSILYQDKKGKKTSSLSNSQFQVIRTFIVEERSDLILRDRKAVSVYQKSRSKSVAYSNVSTGLPIETTDTDCYIVDLRQKLPSETL